MKFVFEFSGEPQATFSGQRYARNVTEPPSQLNGRMEGLVADVINGKEGDVVYLEGSLSSIRLFAERVMDFVEIYEEQFKEELAAEIENSYQCNECKCWADRRYEPGHPDGLGHICLGDGTMLITGDWQPVIIYHNEEDRDISHETVLNCIKDNDCFTLTGKYLPNEDKSHMYIAIGDAFKWKDGYANETMSVKVARRK